MKRYDRICPVCGRLNRALFLEETEGWMECERCGILANVWLPQMMGTHFPLSAGNGAAACKAAGC